MTKKQKFSLIKDVDKITEAFGVSAEKSTELSVEVKDILMRPDITKFSDGFEVALNTINFKKYKLDIKKPEHLIIIGFIFGATLSTLKQLESDPLLKVAEAMKRYAQHRN